MHVKVRWDKRVKRREHIGAHSDTMDNDDKFYTIVPKIMTF